MNNLYEIGARRKEEENELWFKNSDLFEENII